MWKFQEQNEIFQDNRAKMAGGLALALTRNDQEQSEKKWISSKSREVF